MPAAFKWTSEELQDMVTSYPRGETAHSIAKRYGTSHQVIIPVLVRQGVTLRSPQETYMKVSCNRQYFHVIDTEEKAYWLGFVTADGFIMEAKKQSQSPRVEIHLAKQDYQHLVKFKKALQASQVINMKEKSCSITIFSSEMAADLACHGVVPRKTFSTKPAMLAPDLMRHYWRGIMDGDGCLMKKALILVGDYEIMLGFQQFVLSHCPYVKASIYRKENIYDFHVTGKAIPTMLHVLYDGASVFLDRKYVLAQQIMGRG